jgi:rare lipoprotein A
MVGRILRHAGLRRALVASQLALLAACAAPPGAPAPTAPLPPLSILGPAQAVAAEPVAKVVLPGEPSRLSALARRLLDKFRHSPEPDPAPPAGEGSIDEKYRFTGEAARELERGHASWYGGRFHGQPTASGETYDKYALTAAHKTLPFGTIVRVRSLALGREVDVRINDRGPFAPGRVIDVSQAAAEALGLTGAGVAKVSLNVAESAFPEAALSRRSKKMRSAAGAGRHVKSAKRDASARRSASVAKRKTPGASKRR